MHTLFLLAHSRLVNFSVGVLMAAVWGIFVMSHIEKFTASGEYIFLLFCFSESLQVLFFLIRKNPKTVSLDPFVWLVAIGGTFVPLFFRPGGSVLWPQGEWLIVLGVIIQMLAILSLNRSFAMVAARREIKTGGLYRVVRHPMYASYAFLFSGYLLLNAGIMNAGLLVFFFTLLLFRIFEEEKHLSEDAEYRAYIERVKWRLLPYIF